MKSHSALLPASLAALLAAITPAQAGAPPQKKLAAMQKSESKTR